MLAAMRAAEQAMAASPALLLLLAGSLGGGVHRAAAVALVEGWAQEARLGWALLQTSGNALCGSRGGVEGLGWSVLQLRLMLLQCAPSCAWGSCTSQLLRQRMNVACTSSWLHVMLASIVGGT
jgi:hypothetical protein